MSRELEPEPEPARLRFADWMARALYHPQRGYYTRQVRTVGRHGDFSTSATVGTMLAKGIACWLREEIAGPSRGTRAVIEVGGGDGSLSQAVRRSLGWWRRRKLQWCMVETSAPLRAQQEAKLGTGSVRWFADIKEALQACDGSALIFHNELLDAFPVTVMQWDATAKQWLELWLEKQEDGWREVLEPAAALEQDFSALPPSAWKAVPLREGRRMELGAACRQWLRDWAPLWKKGAMLTCDYGDTFPELYNRRPQGTVRAYLLQQGLTGPEVYANMGRQDVTADVNFTDLMNWGDSLGWKMTELATLREFLRQRGYSLRGAPERNPESSFLLDQNGAGGAFKILVQRPQ